MEVGEGEEVDRYVLTDSGMRAASCFDGYNALTEEKLCKLWRRPGGWCGDLRGESIVLGQELAVFTCKNVVGDSGYREAGTEVFAESQHQGCLARANRAVPVSQSHIGLSSFPMIRIAIL